MSVDASYMRGLDNKRRPPIIRFAREARFDQRLTEKNGRSCYIDEDIVKVTSPDGGVTLTKVVKDWFSEIAKRPEYMQWLPHFRQMYEDWKSAHDVASVEGTHISNWPLLSPGQVETLLHAGIKTIEDAGKMPDELAASLGAHYIRSKARYWLNASADIGAIAAEAASLRAENETLKADIEDKAKKLAELKAEVERLSNLQLGKDGFDVIAGRTQAVPLRVVQDSHQATQVVPAEEVVSTTPAMPQGQSLISRAQAEEMSMPKLREYAYENNVKPSTSKAETIERLIEAKALS